MKRRAFTRVYVHDYGSTIARVTRADARHPERWELELSGDDVQFVLFADRACLARLVETVFAALKANPVEETTVAD